ncbi:MAG: ribonuclease II [Deltaproteobacteria bacterium CG11_big_fil_rev_8_21_14_0_20_49_13]|nr:MAG: ribonuclease II [Deltaproteobacteria bacterium CG11_big_fil_rev_8_21_14_0_20_49_13]
MKRYKRRPPVNHHVKPQVKSGEETPSNRTLLQEIACQTMIGKNMLPEFSHRVKQELLRIHKAPELAGRRVQDLRQLPWCSIDNDDSLDLDQLSVAEKIHKGMIRIRVAIADVDSLVKKGSALDDHACHNTTSVYTAAEIFPMLPNKLSNDLTSLNFEEDRPAVVIEMDIDERGKVRNTGVVQAMVHNHAKLAYDSISLWLTGKGPAPEAMMKIKGLDENIRIQDRIAQLLRKNRYERGALDLETIQSRPIFVRDTISSLKVEKSDRANELIEDFMIAANEVTVQYLKSKGYPSFRRVVRVPKRWDRIVEIAADHGFKLPPNPNSEALERFLDKERAADPVRFPDLSLTVIKLIGKGEYVVEFKNAKPIGHFALAVTDYTHSTAPNRRYPDLITQRILKAALNGNPLPYRPKELEDLANRCTEKEDDSVKVERRVAKSAAALLLSSRVGETFNAICTGASDKGTFVRLIDPPAEGKLLRGSKYIDVGEELRVELVRADVERGFVDFKVIS